MSNSMQGKRGLIMGVANDRSIAWGIAKAMAEAGAELAFTYQGEAFGKRVEPLAASVGSDFLVDVDVTDDASMDACFAHLGDRWGSLDFVVHAIAFSDKNELTGRFILVGKGDGVNDEIKAAPAIAKVGETGIHAGVIGDIDIHQKIGPDRCGQRFDPLAKG